MSLIEDSFSFLSEEELEIATTYIYRSSISGLTKLPSGYYKKMCSKLCGNPFFRLTELYFDISNNSPHGMLMKYQKKKNSLDYNCGNLYRCYVYSGLAYAEYATGNELAAVIRIRSLIKNNKDNKTIPSHIMLSLVSWLGIIYYIQKDYRSCCQELLYVYKKDSSVLGINILLLFDSMEKLDLITEEKELLRTTKEELYPTTKEKIIIAYYKNKYLNKTNKEQLENIICKHFTKNQGFDQLYLSVMRDELAKLIQETHNYKKMLEFCGY